MRDLNAAPYWNTLPKAQGTLWARLGTLPKHVVLYGGTALALQLGHRKSVGLDFLSAQPVDPAQLHATLDFLADGRVTQQERNTLTVQAATEDGAVSVSFFGGLNLRCVDPPIRIPPGVRLAGVRDIFGCKCAVVQRREDPKDIQDICALLRHGIPLAEGLACAKAIYGDPFNAQITLMALSYPRMLKKLPEEDRRLLTRAVEEIQDAPVVAVEPLGRIGRVAPLRSDAQAPEPIVGASMPDRSSRLLRLARHVNWYEPPQKVAADARKLLNETMARGSDEDIDEARALFSKEQFIDAYRHAPAGLFSRRHWAYWGLALLGDVDALPYPARYPEVEWEWPASFQDRPDPRPATADDINWVAPK